MEEDFDMSAPGLVWMINAGLNEMSDQDKQDIKNRLHDILCTHGNSSIPVIQEHLCMCVFLNQSENIENTIELNVLDKLILETEKSGKYDKCIWQKEEIYNYILTMGYDKQPRFNTVLGCVLSSLIVSYIEKNMTFNLYNSVDTYDSEKQRMKSLLRALSKKCTYERTGDVYIHCLLKSKLYAHKKTLLGTKDTPYDAISAQYESDANELVRPYMDTDPDSKIQEVKWNSTSDLDGFQFVVGILREALDGFACRILCNTDIAQGILLEQPYFFVISEHLNLGVGSVFGYGIRNQLYIAPHEQPHLNTIYSFLSSPLHISTHSLVEFRTACNTPELLSASSPYYSISESIVHP